MTDPDEIVAKIDRMVADLFHVRALTPCMRGNLIGKTRFRTAPLYRRKGYNIHFEFPSPLTEEDIDRYRGVGDWINQSFVIRLCALLESHEVLLKPQKRRRKPDKKREATTKFEKVVKGLRGAPDARILVGLRNAFAHKGNRHNPKRRDERELFQAILTRYALQRNAHPAGRKSFPIPIDDVLKPMADGCKKYVRALGRRKSADQQK